MSGRSRWGDAMRCLVCGAEKRLEEIALDETAPVSGFQRHTFKCSSCGDVEERLAFVKEHSQADAVASAPENEDDGQRLTGVSEAEPNFADAVPLDPESSVLLTSAPENEDDVDPSFAKDVCGDIKQPPTVVSEADPSHADVIPSDLVPPVSPPSAAENQDDAAPENEDDKAPSLAKDVCGDIEQPLTVVSETEPSYADAIPLDAESSVLLTSAPENKDAVAPSFAKDVCGDIEQPLTLVSEAKSSHADAIPPDLVPPVSPPSAAETEDGVAPTFANRVAAKLSRICRVVGRRLSHGGEQRSPVSDLAVPHISTPPCEPVSDPSIRPTWPALAEPVAAATTSSTLVSRESDSYVDECENLLRRAIKKVGVQKSSSQASASLAEADSAAPASVARPCEAELETLTMALRPLEAESAALSMASSQPATDSEAPIMASSHLEAGSAASNAATNLPDAEPAAPTVASSLSEDEPAAPALGESPAPTITSSNNEAQSPAPTIASDLAEPGSAAYATTTSTAEAEPASPAIDLSIQETGSASSTTAENSPTRRLVMQIEYDSAKAKYVVKDINTGVRILRHEDVARLKAMCDRMGWQVVDGQASSNEHDNGLTGSGAEGPEVTD